ncbi:MAG: acyltransferase [Nitrospira sp.]|nr:acyltransferase [Nitrospira sp.]
MVPPASGANDEPSSPLEGGASSHPIRPHYRPDIDGLRALAVLGVVTFHAFPNWVKGGFVGVDVFFVVSGFLISAIILEGLECRAFSLYEFYGRRIRRVFPALLAVMTASYAFGWFSLLGEEYKQLGKHMLGAAGFVSNVILWSEGGYFDGAAETKPLLHLWSLGVEEQFYIVWPVLLWAAWKKRINLLLVTLALLVLSCFLNINGIGDDLAATFYLPHTRVWELLAGAVLAQVSLHRQIVQRVNAEVTVSPAGDNVESRARRLRDGQSVLGLLLVTFAIMFIEKEYSFPGLWAIIPVLGAGLVIGAGADAWGNRVLLSHKAVVWVGLISYPLYLWHWPLLSFARLIQGEPPSTIVRIAAVLISMVLAWLTYTRLENPVRYGRHNTAATIALAGLMIVAGCIGYTTYYGEGLAFRQAVQGLAKQPDDLVFASGRSSGVWICDDAAFRNVHCELDGESEPVAILIGDSHAPRLYAGLKRIYAESRAPFALFGGKNGCPPFVNLISEDRPEATERNCSEVTLALRYILADPVIKEVVMTSRGPLYTSGVGYGPMDHPSIYLRAEDQSREVAGNLTAYLHSLGQTLTALRKAGKRVVFVFDNPELGFDPKRCLDVRPFRVEGPKFQCSIEVSDYLARNLEYKTVVARTLKRFDNVRIIDLSRALCNETLCIAKIDGRLLYTDDDHLSEFGANFVVTVMRDEFVHASKVLRPVRLESVAVSITR